MLDSHATVLKALFVVVSALFCIKLCSLSTAGPSHAYFLARVAQVVGRDGRGSI